MPSVNKAYKWAVQKCEAPNVGYSQTYRNQKTVKGITYYDCSSFIWYALMAGGWDVVTAHGGTWPFTTRNMINDLFTLGWNEYDIATTQGKPGDVLWRAGHTEMVYSSSSPGSFRTMGAHSAKYKLVDQVSINANESTNWSRLFRYGSGGTGKDDYGWTLEAFCALLGSVSREGNFNPGQIENGQNMEDWAGHGLIQWTSANHNNNTNPILRMASIHGKPWYDGNFQCEMINGCDNTAYTVFDGTKQWGWIGRVEPTNFEDFKKGTDLYQLTAAWVKNVERPGGDVEDEIDIRYGNALMWYDELLPLQDNVLSDDASWNYNITDEYGALDSGEIYENALIMYDLFCGSGQGGVVPEPTPGKPKSKIWQMIRYF